MTRVYLCLFLLLGSTAASSQPSHPLILPLRERVVVEEEILNERVGQLLPGLMRRAEIDLWVVIAREYNEDPVLRTLLPPDWMWARRTTMLLMYDPGGDAPVECLAVARYDVGDVFKRAWNPEEDPDQWKRLADLIAARNPRRIGVNTSEYFAQADGLTHTHHEQLMAALPRRLADRVVSAEKLAIGWLETRTPREMVIYEHLAGIAHGIIAEGFSERHIQPGVTTTDDVVWWFRERVAALGLDTWFHPTVDVQRPDPERFDHLRTFSKRPDPLVIQPGDLLHCDFGVTYLGLNTDTQENAYVLRPGEREPPADLRAAYRTGLRVMDILTNEFKTGRTGNQMLRAALDQAQSEGIKATIYTHPIGYYGHGSGPTIGMWDQQGGVLVNGDYPLYPHTCYAIELNAAVPLWGKEVRVMLEETAYFDGERVRYLNGRQQELMLIPRPTGHLSAGE
ncbi:MAG: M24 family metallopeptidase [Catalinimonas sp.]